MLVGKVSEFTAKISLGNLMTRLELSKLQKMSQGPVHYPEFSYTRLVSRS
jgi:hypothetical protein